jgi:thioredoxin 1
MLPFRKAIAATLTAAFMAGAALSPARADEPAPKSFEEDVTSTNKLVVVDFYATWCKACKKLSPILDEIEKENPNILKVVRVDADERPDLIQKAGIKLMPTLLTMQDAHEVSRKLIIPVTKENVVGFINDSLKIVAAQKAQPSAPPAP